MENLREIYPNIDDRIIEDFAKLSTIDFTYKPEAQTEYGVNDKEHIGVIAQELKENPATEAVIDDSGKDLLVDAGQLALTDTAVIAELCRRVLALEEQIKNM